MIALKQLSEISSYRPVRGDALRLFQLVEEDFKNRHFAKEVFLNNGDNEYYFREVYKNLKDNLVNGIFTNSFKDYTAIQKATIKVWKGHGAAKIAIQTAKKEAGIKLAKETFRQAKRLEMVDVALSLARELEIYYATVDIDTKNFKKFSSEVIFYERQLMAEVKVLSALSALFFAINRKKPPGLARTFVKQLEPFKQQAQGIRFWIFYYTAKTHLAQADNDLNLLIQTCKEAINFFDSKGKLLPYTTKFVFYFQLIPVYISKGEYHKAEAYTQMCLELPTKGSYNWSITLIYLAIIGFHSGKPNISFESLKLYRRTKKKFNSSRIDEHWSVINAYISWFQSIGDLPQLKTFKIGKFLNEVPSYETDKEGLKVSVIIIHLLHLLSRNDRVAFQTESERTQYYITRNLKGKENLRAKHFLKSLIQIDKYDYQPDVIQKYCKKDLNVLKSVPRNVDLKSLESEIIPYEILWNKTMKLLKTGSRSNQIKYHLSNQNNHV